MNNKKKLLIFEPLSNIAGGQMVLINLLPFLVREFSVTVVLPKAGPLRDRLTALGIKSIIINPGSYSLVKKNIFQVLKYLFYLPVFLIRSSLLIKNFDVIYVNGARLLPAVVGADFLFRRPIIWHSHSLISDQKSLYLVELAARWRIVKKIIAVSNFIVSNNEKLRNKTLVLYNGVDLDRFKPGRKYSSSKSVSIVTIGDLIPTKGQDMLIRALAAARGDYLLKIVGSARSGRRPYELSLHDLVKTLSLDNKIEFWGQRDDIPDILSNADLLVLPATVPEACPMVVLEAMAGGVPVIASDLGGTREIVKDGYVGYLFRANNEIDLTRKLDQFFGLDKAAISEMKINCRREAESRYNLENNANKIILAIKELLN